MAAVAVGLVRKDVSQALTDAGRRSCRGEGRWGVRVRWRTFADVEGFEYVSLECVGGTRDEKIFMISEGLKGFIDV